VRARLDDEVHGAEQFFVRSGVRLVDAEARKIDVDRLPSCRQLNEA